MNSLLSTNVSTLGLNIRQGRTAGARTAGRDKGNPPTQGSAQIGVEIQHKDPFLTGRRERGGTGCRRRRSGSARRGDARGPRCQELGCDRVVSTLIGVPACLAPDGHALNVGFRLLPQITPGGGRRKVKLLVDQNLSPRLCDHLCDIWTDVVHVRAVGLTTADGLTFWAYVRLLFWSKMIQCMPGCRRWLAPWRERVVSVGVAFPDTAVPAVDEQLAALIPSDLSRGIDGLMLGLVYRTGALTAGPTDSPSTIVRNDMLITFLPC